MNQRGYIFRPRRSKWWYGRWREEVIEKGTDGNSHIRRRQKCERLCEYSDKYRTRRDVQPLLDEKLLPFNTGRIVPESSLTVCDFAEKYFFPRALKDLRPATYHGYMMVWKGYLRARLENCSLREFRCVDASNILEALYQRHKLGRTTLGHCKVLMHVIFKSARQLGFLDAPNPVTDAKIPTAAHASEPTKAYSAQEVIAMLDTLGGTAKASVALMFFCGLRPSEARALRWEDYDAKSKTIRVARSMWRGFTNEPKTRSSIGTIPVPQVLADILDATPHASDYVLTSALGRPVDLHNFASRAIRPALAKCAVCRKERHNANGHEYKPILEWRGFYALRRGCATLATSLDTPLAAKSLLRHANVQTTAAYYIKSVPEDAVRASQKIDALFSHADGPSN